MKPNKETHRAATLRCNIDLIVAPVRTSTPIDRHPFFCSPTSARWSSHSHDHRRQSDRRTRFTTALSQKRMPISTTSLYAATFCPSTPWDSVCRNSFCNIAIRTLSWLWLKLVLSTGLLIMGVVMFLTCSWICSVESWTRGASQSSMLSSAPWRSSSSS